MNRTSYYSQHTLVALLFFVVFLTTLLLKPVHALLAHQGHATASSELNHQGSTITHAPCLECPICDFEFCTFVPQKQISIEQAVLLVRNERTSSTSSLRTDSSERLYQLRAPPAL